MSPQCTPDLGGGILSPSKIGRQATVREAIRRGGRDASVVATVVTATRADP